ncbi:hypothetical protein TTHERM_001100469 (macronuclear) [Tetrahymena thermophila SB210]|uniref:Uncharacterized protein n=1 Tax=Tetrahymena thermophila (strain SB210) TaxID=312017 RepID=W7X3Y6_TETTS|nr:hypothetical protein TTHERM_001100469 [Tetrahymena thermophila SB210]EWS72152.1 hypothetical protein TTHERM_001100469 [Tetrahymena thermophila SB210]|eukprot:XP_012655314.1 hypothetical protein TTHERM_001100469 [Tetrahymena thermophila SB210]
MNNKLILWKVTKNIVLKLQIVVSSFQSVYIYISEEIDKNIESIIEIFSKLFKNAEMKGLKLFNAIKQENSNIFIINKLIYGYPFSDTEIKIKIDFTANLIISQQQNFALYSLYKNPYTVSGKHIKNIINIIKLKVLIIYNSQELSHYKLKSIKEYDFSFSSLRQKKLERHYSNKIEQIIKEINTAKEHAVIGTRKINNKLENPTLVQIKLYQEIRQLKEKNYELSGLYIRIQNEKRVEITSTFVSWLDIMKTQT